MKIDLKLLILWSASLVIFAGSGIATVTSPDWMSGVQGLIIRFFLGYCSIIVVAQVFAVVEVICCLSEKMSSSKSHFHTDWR